MVAGRFAFEFIIFEFERLMLLFDRFMFPFDVILVFVLIGVDVAYGVAFVRTPTFEFAFRIFAFKFTFVSPHAVINAPIDASVQTSRIFLICGLLSKLKNSKPADPDLPSLRSAGGP